MKLRSAAGHQRQRLRDRLTRCSCLTTGEEAGGRTGCRRPARLHGPGRRRLRWGTSTSPVAGSGWKALLVQGGPSKQAVAPVLHQRELGAGGCIVFSTRAAGRPGWVGSRPARRPCPHHLGSADRRCRKLKQDDGNQDSGRVSCHSGLNSWGCMSAPGSVADFSPGLQLFHCEMGAAIPGREGGKEREGKVRGDQPRGSFRNLGFPGILGLMMHKTRAVPNKKRGLDLSLKASFPVFLVPMDSLPDTHSQIKPILPSPQTL